MKKQYKFAIKKLVRDRSGISLRAANVITHERVLDEAVYLTELRKKLLEEALEVTQAASLDELMEECADVLEVIHALVKTANQSLADLEEIRQKKFADKGGFYKKLYTDSIEMDEDCKYLSRFLTNPDKYPLI